MVTIRRLAPGLVALAISLSSAFSEPVMVPVSSTPYDNQMSRIQPFLQCSKQRSTANLSVLLVNHWIGELRSIPYGFSTVWKTPGEVEGSPIADCKGKAVTLYQRMKLNGADNLRLVIGRRTSMSRSTHAWLEWTTTNGTYVLDPTINWMAYRLDRVGGRTYIPLYAYSGTRKYRAMSSTLVAQN